MMTRRFQRARLGTLIAMMVVLPLHNCGCRRDAGVAGEEADSMAATAPSIVARGSWEAGATVTLALQDAKTKEPVKDVLMVVEFSRARPAEVRLLGEARGIPYRTAGVSLHVLDSGEVLTQQSLPSGGWVFVSGKPYEVSSQVEYSFLKLGYRTGYMPDHRVGGYASMDKAAVTLLYRTTANAAIRDVRGSDLVSDDTNAEVSAEALIRSLPHVIAPPERIDAAIDIIIPRLATMIARRPEDAAKGEELVRVLSAWRHASATHPSPNEPPYRLLRVIARDATTGRGLAETLTVLAWRQTSLVAGQAPAASFQIRTATAYLHPQSPVELAVSKEFETVQTNVGGQTMTSRWAADVYLVKSGYEPVKKSFDDVLTGSVTAVELLMQPVEPKDLVRSDVVRELSKDVLPVFTGPTRILEAVQEAIGQ